MGTKHRTRGRVDLGPEPDRGSGRGAAQVEVAVAQACLLADGDALVDLERQRCGRVEDGQLDGRHLDLAGRQVRVGRVLWTYLDDAFHGDAVLVAQGVRAAGREDLVAHDDLYEAARVTQVEERHPTEVSPLRHPSRKRHLLPRVLSTQSPCLVGTDHRLPSLGFKPSYPTGSPLLGSPPFPEAAAGFPRDVVKPALPTANLVWEVQVSQQPLGNRQPRAARGLSPRRR